MAPRKRSVLPSARKVEARLGMQPGSAYRSEVDRISLYLNTIAGTYLLVKFIRQFQSNLLDNFYNSAGGASISLIFFLGQEQPSAEDLTMGISTEAIEVARTRTDRVS
jgi:hypothetical protein